MRKAPGWRVSSPVASRGKRAQRGVLLNCFWVLFSDVQMQQMQPSSQQDNAVCVVYPLSHSMCVNQKPQRVEGLGEMDIDVMWMRIFLLCALACVTPVQLCLCRNPIKKFCNDNYWTVNPPSGNLYTRHVYVSLVHSHLMSCIQEGPSCISKCTFSYLILGNSDWEVNTFSFQSQLPVLRFHLKTVDGWETVLFSNLSLIFLGNDFWADWWEDLGNIWDSKVT